MNPQNPPPFVPVGTPSEPASGAQRHAGGFCQQCGTALTPESRRDVGGSVFCEPCLAARLTGAPAANLNAAAYPAWAAGPEPVPAGPNPALAALLGLIPGVGAMYNEQYAKGIAHLIIFALLIVLANANGVFGLFVAGWEFYMAIESYHTARARRSGAPLPNPFGFNDLGDRLGFAKGWSAPSVHPAREASPFTPVAPAAEPFPPFTASVPPVTSPAQGAPVWTDYAPNPQTAPYQTVPAQAPFADVIAEPAPATTPFTRVPAGAVWLILLGVVFLLSTTGLFREFSAEALLGWSFIGLAAWLFLRRYKELATGGLSPLRRITRSLDTSIWLLTSGVLALLDSSSVLNWGRSWPIFIIVAGVVVLLGRLSAPQPGVLTAGQTAQTAGPKQF